MIEGKEVTVGQVLIVRNPMTTVLSMDQANVLEMIKEEHAYVVSKMREGGQMIARISNRCQSCRDHWPCDAYRVADMILEGRGKL